MYVLFNISIYIYKHAINPKSKFTKPTDDRASTKNHETFTIFAWIIIPIFFWAGSIIPQLIINQCFEGMWAMVNTHYMVDGHPIHNKDPYNGYYKSLWTIGWLAPINGY